MGIATGKELCDKLLKLLKLDPAGYWASFQITADYNGLAKITAQRYLTDEETRQLTSFLEEVKWQPVQS